MNRDDFLRGYSAGYRDKLDGRIPDGIAAFIRENTASIDSAAIQMAQYQQQLDYHVRQLVDSQFHKLVAQISERLWKHDEELSVVGKRIAETRSEQAMHVNALDKHAERLSNLEAQLQNVCDHIAQKLSTAFGDLRNV